ncbi:MAG TPA: GHKL domain-containing protein [Clostridiales bacterium]|nr:GHKL domain-containing protein [Clostridiales bacterium]
MIKKLQRKFIMITMGSLFLVMLFLIGLTNGIYFVQTEIKTNESISIIAENEGKFPEFIKGDHMNGPPKTDEPFTPLFGFRMNAETPYEKRYFIVELGFDGSVNQINTSHIAAVTSKDALEYATDIIESGKTGGYMGIYKYKVIEKDTGNMIVFMDCRSQIQSELLLLVISCVVGVSTLILMFVLLTVLSRRAMRPFVENAEKQKLFITDAGHEIKTPLAIISANADVLELTGGENEWIGSIRNQVARLDKLVKNLLTLSKMEEEGLKLTFAHFNLSEAVAKIAGSFEAVAEAKNKRLRMDIQPGIMLNGDEDSMEQLVSTLMDNAMKYSNDGGSIKISLAGTKKGVKLEVYNTAESLDASNLDRLFDRFYRADSSRARETGGYGIGLSIAKSIVEAHKGRISVKSEDGKSICFTVLI